ncbi:hypothetical protein [Tunturiibacter gelidoferens]|uniref:Uncharacterized protein n=1 Tax=Tunturiibacter gelidiferens TaxID=3069689 RepID=A0A9X0U345_9BACT|nr:hypothetical protein [Edaphobacter lichenicola]MBB5327923.1 hypothetical protein [Edaphobacter lichenicola]
MSCTKTCPSKGIHGRSERRLIRIAERSTVRLLIGQAVDQIHKVSSDLGGSERTLAKANEEIDAIALAIESNVSWTSPRFTLASQNKMPALSKNHSWKRTLWVS